MRRARDVCEGICDRMIHFLYYCKYEILFFGDDGTGPADESKKDETHPGMVSSNYGRGFHYVQSYLLRELTNNIIERRKS